MKEKLIAIIIAFSIVFLSIASAASAAGALPVSSSSIDHPSLSGFVDAIRNGPYASYLGSACDSLEDLATTHQYCLITEEKGTNSKTFVFTTSPINAINYYASGYSSEKYHSVNISVPAQTDVTIVNIINQNYEVTPLGIRSGTVNLRFNYWATNYLPAVPCGAAFASPQYYNCFSNQASINSNSVTYPLANLVNNYFKLNDYEHVFSPLGGKVKVKIPVSLFDSVTNVHLVLLDEESDRQLGLNFSADRLERENNGPGENYIYVDVTDHVGTYRTLIHSDYDSTIYDYPNPNRSCDTEVYYDLSLIDTDLEAGENFEELQEPVIPTWNYPIIQKDYPNLYPASYNCQVSSDGKHVFLGRGVGKPDFPVDVIVISAAVIPDYIYNIADIVVTVKPSDIGKNIFFSPTDFIEYLGITSPGSNAILDDDSSNYAVDGYAYYTPRFYQKQGISYMVEGITGLGKRLFDLQYSMETNVIGKLIAGFSSLFLKLEVINQGLSDIIVRLAAMQPGASLDSLDLSPVLDAINAGFAGLAWKGDDVSSLFNVLDSLKESIDNITVDVTNNNDYTDSEGESILSWLAGILKDFVGLILQVTTRLISFILDIFGDLLSDLTYFLGNLTAFFHIFDETDLFDLSGGDNEELQGVLGDVQAYFAIIASIFYVLPSPIIFTFLVGILLTTFVSVIKQFN